MRQRPDESKSARPADMPALSPGRKWLFRLIALVLLPLLLLVGMEIVLRLAGYGYPTNFLKKIRVGDADYLVNNENFSRRFFPPALARWPDPFIIPVVKPPDTVRIFIFGESAAMGDPQPAYGASRYLEVLLRQRFPGEKFEVINLGITAINSHVILPIARDCSKAGGDFWIVYMGNNEMVGPYGAATVFGAQALPRSAVRFNLAIQQTRLGQLLVAGLRRLGGKPKNASWGGMEMFLDNCIAPADPRKETVYRNFEGNLRDIVAAGMGSGASVLLNTVSVNLKDCPPFASLSDSNLPAADWQRFDRVFTDAKSLQSQSNFSAAAELFSQAVKLDPPFAEAHYRLAGCELELTNAAGPQEFQTACDLDALPFRADSRINRAIHQVAQEYVGGRMIFCDAENALAQACPAHTAGDETFFEHVHFNFDGNYRLGKIWAEQIGQALLAAGQVPATTKWATAAACDRALGLSLWNRQFVLLSEIQRFSSPPLSTQPNNAGRLEKVQAEELRLRGEQAQPGAVERARADYNAAVELAPRDAYLQAGLAGFLEAIHDPAVAVAAYRRILELRPDDCNACLQLGRLLAEQGKPEQAEPFLRQVAQLRPYLPESWFKLGIVMAAQQQFAAALECMEHAARLRPQDASYVCYLGEILVNLNRRPEAVEQFRRAIQMSPDQWEAHFGLAGEYVAANQLAAAAKEYAEVVRLKPGNALAHLNLGVMQARLGRFDEALRQFDETLRLDPGNPQAREYITLVQNAQNQRR